MAGRSRIARYPVAAGSANSSNAAHTKARALCAPGREAPPALGELPAVQPREEGLVIGVSPRKSQREPSDELRRKSVPRRALQPFQPLEQLVEQAELLVGQLRRACFERL